jgi:hypothetical protein
MDLKFIKHEPKLRPKTLADVPEDINVPARCNGVGYVMAVYRRRQSAYDSNRASAGLADCWHLCDIDGNIEYIDDTPPLSETLGGAEPGTVWECCNFSNGTLRFIATVRGFGLPPSVQYADGSFNTEDRFYCRPLRYIGKLEVTE